MRLTRWLATFLTVSRESLRSQELLQPILSSCSSTSLLREWLNEEGFAIRRETLAQDGKFYYPVMEIVHAQNPLPVTYYGGKHV